MKERALDPRRLDVAGWARDGRRLQGHWPLTQCRRLSESLAGPAESDVAWYAEPSRLAPDERAALAALHLYAAAEVPLTCQRCLHPLLHPLAVDRRFLFAASEDEAARLDEESDDDVLVLSRAFDLLALLEDELILGLPIVPRHEECPLPLPAAMTAGPVADEPASEPAPDEHPFSALSALKRG